MNSRNLVCFLCGVAAGGLAVRTLAQRRPAATPDPGNPLGAVLTGPISEHASVPQATVAETLSVVGEVVLPTLAKGVIIRRPTMVALAERLNLDQRAVRRLQKLRNRYGRGPLLLRIPLRRQALILNPEHVERVLNGSPEPFATATWEKQHALSHFQPRGVLISHGPERAERRRFNEEVLDSGCPVHHLAESFLSRLQEETEALLDGSELAWGEFSEAWFRGVRRLVLGDSARNDRELTAMLAELRGRANWSFLAPENRALRERVLSRIRNHLDRREPGSLAAWMSQAGGTEATAPEDQVAHWLFAFDAAAMATYRALALLASHPEHLARARAEICSEEHRLTLPYLRACVLEAVRLWPTTPMILRETTRETEWETGTLPAHTHVLIFVPFFHRDDQRLPQAHRFAPELWENDQPRSAAPLVPFSDGPAVCPARSLVLLLGSHLLRLILATHDVRPEDPTRLAPHLPLPATLNPFTLRFHVSPRRSSPRFPRNEVPDSLTPERLNA